MISSWLNANLGNLLNEIKLIVFVFSSLIILSSFNFLIELETAVGDTFSIIAISLWLSFSPALMHNKEKISCSNYVNLSLYISILLYICKVEFISLFILLFLYLLMISSWLNANFGNLLNEKYLTSFIS